MPVTQVLGHIHITNKSLVYIVGLQVSPCFARVVMYVLFVLLSLLLFLRTFKNTCFPTSLILIVCVLFSPPSVVQLLTSSPFMWLLALSGLVSSPYIKQVYW